MGPSKLNSTFNDRQQQFRIGSTITKWYMFGPIIDMGSTKKSCSKGILESCGLPEAKRVFAMEH